MLRCHIPFFACIFCIETCFWRAYHFYTSRVYHGLRSDKCFFLITCETTIIFMRQLWGRIKICSSLKPIFHKQILRSVVSKQISSKTQCDAVNACLKNKRRHARLNRQWQWTKRRQLLGIHFGFCCMKFSSLIWRWCLLIKCFLFFHFLHFWLLLYLLGNCFCL